MQCNQEFRIPGMSVSACLFSWLSCLFISLQTRWQSKSWLKPALITSKWVNTWSEGWRSFLSPSWVLQILGVGKGNAGMWNRSRTQGVRPRCCGQLLWWVVLPPLPLVQSGSPKSILSSRVGNMEEMIKFAQIREDCRTGLERQCFLTSSASKCVCLCESTLPQ